MKAWAKSFYLSAAWEKTRAAYLMSQDYICERCGQPAKIVHHKRWLNRENINDISVISLVFMLAIDVLIKINLIGFIPEQARTYLGLDTVGVAEFFALLYIAYEVVSIFKNMALCGLPVKKVWEKVREFLAKYTDELPDTDELDGDSTTGSVEEHRTQER